MPRLRWRLSEGATWATNPAAYLLCLPWSSGSKVRFPRGVSVSLFILLGCWEKRRVFEDNTQLWPAPWALPIFIKRAILIVCKHSIHLLQPGSQSARERILNKSLLKLYTPVRRTQDSMEERLQRENWLKCWKLRIVHLSTQGFLTEVYRCSWTEEIIQLHTVGKTRDRLSNDW